MKASLISPLQVGKLTLSNRVVMAPLTRCRAGESRIPNDMMVEYYRQRSSSGLILSEATAISQQALGYSGTPGIWNAAQVEGWKAVTKAVHESGGLIFLQLWHVGRISDPVYLNGELPVAPSAIAQEGMITRVQPHRPYVTPRALETEEIPGIVQDYVDAGLRATEAGFDGVEIHGANGYLLDQFMHSTANARTDQYGGSIENRSRFLLEVTDGLVDALGSDQVGVHLAPRGDSEAAERGDGFPLFSYVAEQLGKRKIAFICSREPMSDDWFGPRLKQLFGGPYIANEAFTKESAEAVISNGQVDAVAFGRPFISNPDLPYRLENNHPLLEADPATFYGDGTEGYTDYGFVDPSAATA